jgi:voltage-gated potassium channel
VDFLATFPIYLILFAASARYFLVIRAFRLIRVFRVFKLFNFMNEGEVLLQSLMMSWKKIFVFFFFVVIMVTSIGTLMYMIEGQQPGTAFDSIPSSIYWAIVTMTTVGYGDITPVTALGRFLSAVVMLMGYTIIAVPTGIVSAAAFKAFRNSKAASRCEHCGHVEHDSSARYCKYCGEALVRKNKTTK